MELDYTERDAALDHHFKPLGATTFFILLLILGAIIWFGVYFYLLYLAS